MKLPYFVKNHLASPSNKIQTSLKQTVSVWRNHGDSVFSNQETHLTKPPVLHEERKMQIPKPPQHVTDSQQRQQKRRTMYLRMAAPKETARSIQSQRLRHVSRADAYPQYKPQLSISVIPPSPMPTPPRPIKVHKFAPYESNRATNSRHQGRRNGRKRTDVRATVPTKISPYRQRQLNIKGNTKNLPTASLKIKPKKQRQDNKQRKQSRQSSSQNPSSKKRHQNTKVKTKRQKSPPQNPPSNPPSQDPVDTPDVLQHSPQSPKQRDLPDPVDPIDRPDGWMPSLPQNPHNKNIDLKKKSNVSLKPKDNVNRRKPNKNKNKLKYKGKKGRGPVTESPAEDPPEPPEAPDVPVNKPGNSRHQKPRAVREY